VQSSINSQSLMIYEPVLQVKGYKNCGTGCVQKLFLVVFTSRFTARPSQKKICRECLLFCLARSRSLRASCHRSLLIWSYIWFGGKNVWSVFFCSYWQRLQTSFLREMARLGISLVQTGEGATGSAHSLIQASRSLTPSLQGKYSGLEFPLK
jgi:hypothetical protein